MVALHSNPRLYPKPLTAKGLLLRAAVCGVVVVALAVMAGCHPKYEVDQELQTHLFHECLDRIPDGPQQAHYNDWAEVVSECHDSSYYRAKYCVERCPPPRSKEQP